MMEEEYWRVSKLKIHANFEEQCFEESRDCLKLRTKNNPSTQKYSIIKLCRMRLID